MTRPHLVRSGCALALGCGHFAAPLQVIHMHQPWLSDTVKPDIIHTCDGQHDLVDDTAGSLRHEPRGACFHHIADLEADYLHCPPPLHTQEPWLFLHRTAKTARCVAVLAKNIPYPL